MDLAYVDELAKKKNALMYLLVRQDLFDRIVDAMAMKKKYPRKQFVHFWPRKHKRIVLKNLWIDKGTEFAGEFKKLCKAEGIQIIQIYSIMSETKAAFAKRTIRSLKKIIYRYREDND